MNRPVDKPIEPTATSTTSIEDAVGKAIKRAHITLKNLGCFQTRGSPDKRKVPHGQVTIKAEFCFEN